MEKKPIVSVNVIASKTKCHSKFQLGCSISTVQFIWLLLLLLLLFLFLILFDFFYPASKNVVVPLLLFVCLFICFTRYPKGLGGYFICVWVIGMSLGKSISALLIENLPVVIHTYDIIMKTRPNGHIANKL